MHGDLALANGSEISACARRRMYSRSGCWLKAPGDDWKMEVLGAPPCSDEVMAPTFADNTADNTAPSARAAAPQAFNVCGPFNLDNKEVLFCLPCDKERILSVEDAYAAHEYECMCVMEQMIDTSVTATNNGATVSWQLFVEDPYPVATCPTATNAERRFVTYQAVAEMLGATGTRMVLPVCATEEALNQFPRP